MTPPETCVGIGASGCVAGAARRRRRNARRSGQAERQGQHRPQLADGEGLQPIGQGQIGQQRREQARRRAGEESNREREPADDRQDRHRPGDARRHGRDVERLPPVVAPEVGDAEPDRAQPVIGVNQPRRLERQQHQRKHDAGERQPLDRLRRVPASLRGASSRSPRAADASWRGQLLATAGAVVGRGDVPVLPLDLLRVVGEGQPLVTSLGRPRVAESGCAGRAT